MSYVAEASGVQDDAGRILVWSVQRHLARHIPRQMSSPRLPALSARVALPSFVHFDPSVDASANAKSVGEVLKGRRIVLVLILDHLEGCALRFTTPHGDLRAGSL